MRKQQKPSSAIYRKLKTTRECDERKCAASLHVLLQKKYVAKAKCKDEGTECTSKVGVGIYEENANVVETNMKIKVEEKFPPGINVVKKLKATMMMF